MNDKLEDFRNKQDNTALQAAITAGVAAGIKQITDDPKFVSAFWKQGFDELATHSGNGASQWVGKRLLTILVTAVAGVCIVWLVKTGAIK